MPKVYFIIVTYNAMKWAERCFGSLRRSSVPVHCIVIDNGSQDGTREYIRAHFPEVDLIESDENLGFGKANNIGIEKAYREGADFFYLMNQDAWIFPDSVRQLIETYRNDPEPQTIGIISPMHLDGSEQRLDLHFENYVAQDARNNRLLSDLYFKETRASYEIRFVNAAHWFLPKKTVEKVGGFNPYFFYGAEDYEYINRASYFGLRILVCPASKAVHDAVQAFHKKQPESQEELLKQKRLSMVMQRETKYLNPSYDYHIPREKAAFVSTIAKMGLKGNRSEYRFYVEQYKYFARKFKEIEAARKTSMTGKHPFLNL